MTSKQPAKTPTIEVGKSLTIKWADGIYRVSVRAIDGENVRVRFGMRGSPGASFEWMKASSLRARIVK
jgi:hypothetical protein